MKNNYLDGNIFTIPHFWSRQECEDFIAKSENIGYEPATINTEKGQKIVENIRNNNRVIYKDAVLGEEIWTKLKIFSPQKIGNSVAIGLNELFRFYKYQAGQQFKTHQDESYIRNETEASYYTLMIYLNDDFEGGETTFENVIITPKQGTALIFLHNLTHAGTAVEKGIKYVLRTDIMFKLNKNISL